MFASLDLKEATGSMSLVLCTSTEGSVALTDGVFSGGGRSLRMAAWLSGERLSGNLIVSMRKRLPWQNGFLYVGMPSSFTAFIILRSFLAFGSIATYIVQPRRVFFAEKTSSRV